MSGNILLPGTTIYKCVGKDRYVIKVDDSHIDDVTFKTVIPADIIDLIRKYKTAIVQLQHLKIEIEDDEK